MGTLMIRRPPREAWLGLALLRFRPGGRRVREALGAALDLWREGGARAGELDDVADGLRRRLGAGDRDPGRVLAGCARLGWQVLVPGDPDFPLRLLDLPDPPACLFVRGRRELLGSPGVALVGSRVAGGPARTFARSSGRLLAASGEAVLCGASAGIEDEALAGAVSGTDAVVGRGGAVAVAPYPPEAVETGSGRARAGAVLARRGLLVTAVPPGTGYLRGAFQLRAWLLAGLARELVLVEARAGSGALLAVEAALELGCRVRLAGLPGGQPGGEAGAPLAEAGCRVVRHPFELVAASGEVRSRVPRRPRAVRLLETEGRMAPDALLARLGERVGARHLRGWVQAGWLRFGDDGLVGPDYLPLVRAPAREADPGGVEGSDRP